MICPKCGFDQEDDGRLECGRCLVVFSKYAALQKRKEQSNSRYSPQAGEEGETPAPPDGDPLPEPELEPAAAAVPPEALVEVQRRLRRVQDGVEGISRFQDTLAAEMERQKARVRDLFGLFTAVRDAVDQQVLQVQGCLQPLTETFRGLEKALSDNAAIAALQAEVRALAEQMECLAPLRQAAVESQRLAQKIEKVDSVQRELREALKNGTAASASAEAAPDLVFIRMELQALRSEVRTLVEPAKEPLVLPEPLPDPRVAAMETKVKELGDRIDEAALALEAEKGARETTLTDLTRKVQEVEDVYLGLAESGDRNREFQSRLDALASAVVSARDDLRRLREREQTREEEWTETRKHLEGIRSLVDRVKSAWQG